MFAAFQPGADFNHASKCVPSRISYLRDTNWYFRQRWDSTDAFAEVKTQMKGRQIDTPVNFQLIHCAHDWRVYDVVIDGVSIVSNYRSQFTSIIRDVSYVGLHKKMRQKAIAVKVFEKPPAP